MLDDLNLYTAPNDERMDKDLIALAKGYLSIVTCPSGRPSRKGLTCAHCGVDYTKDNFCGQPVEEDGYTLFNAAVARRIMMKG